MSHKHQNNKSGIVIFFLTVLSFGLLIFRPALATDASLLPPAVQQFFNSSGNPLSSGKVYFYEVGTSTFKDTYTSSAATTTYTNPITLNAGGKPPGSSGIYGTGLYRQLVKDSAGNTIWDAVTAPGGGGSTPTAIGDGNSVGTILPWSSLTAPNQYVFAYGQELARSTYPELYTAITQQLNAICSASSNTLTGISDTTQINIGSPIELSLCVISGTTVVSKTGSTVTLSNPSSVSVSGVATFFPYGNGNGTTTFNVPDLRGYAIAGRDNMGGSAAGRLTATYFNTPGVGAVGGLQTATLSTSNLPAYTPTGTISSSTIIAPNPVTTPFSAGATSGGTTVQGNVSDVLLATTTSTFTGTAQGGTRTAFSNVQPTITLNYIIKVTPDVSISVSNVVTALGGMTGVISCGTGILCSGHTISASVTSAALTKTNDTNVTMTLGGSPSTALLSAASLNLGWTGQLAVSRGGTGAATFTANAPLIGNGTSAITQGSRSGNTTTFATATGALTNGHCVSIDSSGNLIDAGGACTTGGGGGTVAAGTINQLAYYASTGSVVNGTDALPNNTTATTQVVGDATTKVATDAFVQNALPPKHVSNGGSVLAGPYQTVASGSANFGPSTGQTALDFVSVGHNYRMLQDGTVSKAGFYLPSTTGITALYVKVWRQQGTKFDLVGVSDNIVASIGVGTNLITLGTPISGVQAGDYVGLRLEYTSASAQNIFASTVSNNVIYSVLNATPATAQYDWAAHTTTSSRGIIVTGYMSAPIFVAIGDSIVSGFSSARSYADGDATNLLTIIQSYPYALGLQLGGVVNQNVGISGQSSTAIAARFAVDVVAKNPTLAIIEGGVNDILASVSNVTIIANYTSMLNAALAAGIKPVVIGVLPFAGSGGSTNAMLQQRDALNILLRALVTNATYNGVYVNPDPMGTYFVTGDANNLWQLAYQGTDATHPSPAGYIRLAQIIYDTLQGLVVEASLVPGGFNVQPGFYYNFNGVPILWGQGSLLNTFVGFGTGLITTTGNANTAVGSTSLTALTTGSTNTAVGNSSLKVNTTGSNNTAVGNGALFVNTTGSGSTAVGALALAANITGGANVAIGLQALNSATASATSVAVGNQSLAANLTGTDNTAVGDSSLAVSTDSTNTAIGSSALLHSTSGGDNLGVGYAALITSTTAAQNTSIGAKSLLNVTTGGGNTAVGRNAGGGITTGTNNTIIGANVGSLGATLSGNIILADGTGAIQAQWDGSKWVFTGGLSTTKTVRASGGAADCTLIYTGGLLTGGSC